jgi:hypothetical protein
MIELKMGNAHLMSHLLNMLSKDELVIPWFQRDYVWTLENVQLFVDSIIKKYPIGNLVFMQLYVEGGGTLLRRKPTLWALPPGEGCEWPLYVLDGQQRLMTVVKLFLTGEFQILLPFGAASRKQCFVVRAEDADLSSNYNVSQILWDTAFRGRHQALLARLAAGDPYAAAKAQDQSVVSYSQGLLSARGGDPAFNLALNLADDLRYIDLPYYNLEVTGNSNLQEAVDVFKRLNMAGVPVDIHHLENL